MALGGLRDIDLLLVILFVVLFFFCFFISSFWCLPFGGSVARSCLWLFKGAKSFSC
jgi:hypothetical protein